MECKWRDNEEKLIKESENLRTTNNSLEQELEENIKILSEMKQKVHEYEIERKEVKNCLRTNQSINCSLLATECNDCIEHKNTIERLKNGLERYCRSYEEDIKELKSNLCEAEKKIEDFTEKLKLQDSRDCEIEDLKQKANEFENYMKCKNKNVSTNSTSTNTTNELHDTSNRDRENQIRDECARIFAMEFRNMEQSYINELKEASRCNNILQDELHSLRVEYDVRWDQMEVLKYTIYTERDLSDKAIKDLENRMEKMQNNHKNEMEKCNRRCQQLKNELDSTSKLLIEERQLMAEMQRTCASVNRKLSEQKENNLDELMKRIKELEMKLVTVNEQKDKCKKLAVDYRNENKKLQEFIINERQKEKEALKEKVKYVITRNNRKLKAVLQEAKTNIREMADREFS